MTAPTVPVGAALPRLPRRVLLLAAQTLFFGLALALHIVSANTLFLGDYGAARLPWTYIAVALLGAFFSSALAALQRRFSLNALAIASTAGMGALFLLAWLALTVAGWRWVSFALVVLFPLWISVGFIFIGGQAGRLLDVGQIKRLFPRIVAGFSIGFMLGGFLAAPLLTWFGAAEDLLLVAAAFAAIKAVLIFVTSRRYQDAFATAAAADSSAPPRASLRRLLARRFVLLLFLYQMLSAIGSQLLDYLIISQAAARYPAGEALGRFLGNYTGFLNLVDILFLSLFAGWLLSRFGLRFGLSANPAGVLVWVAAMLVVGLVAGNGSLLFFILVATARIADIALTDGTTRTSLNAAYQALAPGEQLAVQTGIEGIGIPVALGLTGVVLLLFYALAGLDVLVLVTLTLLVAVAWTVTGFLVFRAYGKALVQRMRRRRLAPADLSISDETTLGVVLQFVNSDDPGAVRLGLDLLAAAAHPDLAGHLLRLAQAGPPAVQEHALRLLESQRLSAARPILAALCADPAVPPHVLAAALRAYAALDGPAAADFLCPYIEHAAEDVRAAALVGLLRYGGIPGVLTAGNTVQALVSAPDPGARRLVARVIGEVGLVHYYQPLVPLLADPDPGVRNAALLAVGSVGQADLLPQVVAALADPQTRSAALNALAANRAALLPLLARNLAAGDDRDTVLRLLRICAPLRSEQLFATLTPHLTHPDRDVRQAILHALEAGGYHPSPGDARHLEALLINAAQHGARILAVMDAIGDEAATSPLRHALADEWQLLGQHALTILALTYGDKALRRAGQQLHHARPAARALALEVFEVTLSRPHQALALPLLNPQLSSAQQREQLARHSRISAQDATAWLADLILDPRRVWDRPWLRTCALYAAGATPYPALRDAVLAAGSDGTAHVSETALWARDRLANLQPLL